MQMQTRIKICQTIDVWRPIALQRHAIDDEVSSTTRVSAAAMFSVQRPDLFSTEPVISIFFSNI